MPEAGMSGTTPASANGSLPAELAGVTVAAAWGTTSAWFLRALVMMMLASPTSRIIAASPISPTCNRCTDCVRVPASGAR